MNSPRRGRIPVGILVPLRSGFPGHPSQTPMGRAARWLADQGVDAIFGSGVDERGLVGHRAGPEGWEPAAGAVVAAFDRYPSQTDPEGFAALVGALGGLPVHNPWPVTLLCRDKLETQRHLVARGIAMPEVVDDPADFEGALAAWGSGFLKPRYGAFGRGVRFVRPGDDLPAIGEGAVPGVPEPLLLQRAVAPPQGLAGVCVRVLAQRERDEWIAERPVARISDADPVVNAARGARVALAEEVVPAAHRLADLTLAVAHALQDAESGDGLIEIGVDVVVGADGGLHVLEVNARPRGRLEALAARDSRYDLDHVRATARPLRWLADRYGR